LLSIYTLVLIISILVYRYVIGHRGKARASRQTANELRAVYALSGQAQSSSNTPELPLLNQPPQIRGQERGHERGHQLEDAIGARAAVFPFKT
jgi:hypothetical protein